MWELYPFRFGVVASNAPSRQEWQQRARDLESMGYDVLLVPDHLHHQLSPLPAALSAAEATEDIHVGTLVCAAGLRHPVMLAKEAASLGLLTEGRFELGVGAGWLAQDYQALDIEFGNPDHRSTRFEETLEIISDLLDGKSVHYDGSHYRVKEYRVDPLPPPQTRVPILAGGGGYRVLTAAASSADIVSFTMRSRPDGSGLDPASAGFDMLTRQVGWVEQAANGRSVPPERNLLLQGTFIGPKDAMIRKATETFGIPEEFVPQTPHLVTGTAEEVSEALVTVGEKFGITYLTVFDQYAEAFASVIRLLKS